MRDLSEKLRGAKQTRAMMQNSSGNTSPKEKSLAAYLTEKTVRHQQNDDTEQYLYGKTRYVVERFFAWLKNGFHRTRIRYEKNTQNYLAFVIISSIMTYWRVLG